MPADSTESEMRSVCLWKSHSSFQIREPLTLYILYTSEAMYFLIKSKKKSSIVLKLGI